MSASITLDRPHAHVTNLDFVTGRVILTVPSNESISLIVVKLEGESTSRVDVDLQQSYEQHLVGSRGRNYGEVEVHKLLYQVATVFPTPEVRRAAAESPSYTLPKGRYEYPFRFKVRNLTMYEPEPLADISIKWKVPFNSNCFNPSPMNTNLLGELARASYRHVKNTLPPSLCVIPGEAEIRYFVKATVHRPAFYKENFRAHAPFNFLPIEPPRAPPNRRESFARVQYQFAPRGEGGPKPGFFRQWSTSAASSADGPPNITLDGRLPDPAIITCNEPLPLRVLVTKTNDSNATIYVKFFSVELIGNTDIRAHHLRRHDTRSWIIGTSSNMRLPLGGQNDNESGKPMEVDSTLWRRSPIPNTVAPSFETCNLSRRYSLHIKVGLSYGTLEEVYPELTVQTLHMPVQVFSGIAPPPALLARMADQPTGPSPTPTSFQQQQQPSPSNFHPTRPSHPSLPPRPSVPPPTETFPEDPPPSYEDAIADDFGPVDGPRRDYDHQPHTTNPAGEDRKANGEMGRDERLFPDRG